MTQRRTETELASLIWHSLTRATDFATSALADVRRKAWDYYLNRPRGDEIEGRSQVQSTIIRDTHHALMATIMPSYATDNLIAFEPHGPEDEQAADAESAALNNLFTEDNEGYQQLSNAVSDAIGFRNGVIKVWLSEESEQVRHRFEAPEAMVKAHLKEQGAEADSIEHDPDTGITTAIITREFQKLNFSSVEPSYFGCDPNQQDQNLQESMLMWERAIFTRQELKDMGVKPSKVKQLPQITDESVTAAPGLTSTDIQAKFESGQASHSYTSVYLDQRVECYWVSMVLDGVKQRFLMGNQKILLEEQVNYFNYASGAAWPVPHRWSGLCLYDLMKQTADSQTSIIRQFHDNMNYANNKAHAYDPNETKQSDMETRAPGRNVRSTNPANIAELGSMDITSNSLAALAYWDDIAGKQAGAALDMATAEAQSIKDVSGLSVEMQLGPKEQMASQVGRNIAETLIRQTFLLAHRILREEYRGTLQYRRAGQWVETSPSEWQPRTRMNITVGLSPGDRRRHRANLERVMQMQTQDIMGGAANITTDWKGMHAARTDWMRAAELDGHEGYFLDPESEQSMQAQQVQAEQTQQQGDMAAQMQQITVMLENQKLELDKYKHDTDLKFKYWEQDQESEIAEAKLVADGINNVNNKAGNGAEAESTD